MQWSLILSESEFKSVFDEFYSAGCVFDPERHDIEPGLCVQKAVGLEVIQGRDGNSSLLGFRDRLLGVVPRRSVGALTSTKTMVSPSLAMISTSPALVR